MAGISEKVKVERMIQRIEALATCSSSVHGVTRLAFTDESEQANSLVSQWMCEAGMSVRRDEMGNIIGRYEGRRPDAPILLIGSHLDSVAKAGKFDGILGVITGIEVVQTLFEHDIRLEHPIEIIGFCDEEGTRFHTTFLGSRAMTGSLTEIDLQCCDQNEMTLSDAMKEVGLEPMQYKLAARDPKTILGYIELHIEQGPVLEEMDQSCGVVSGIASQSRYTFQIEGLAGHAGTVPLPMRKDALAGAAEIIQAIETIALQNPNLVATVGKLSVQPGASNVIPGEVEGTLDIRCMDERKKLEVLQAMIEASHQIADRRGLNCTFTKVMDSSPVNCCTQLTRTIQSVLEDYQMNSVPLVSGAGHDAMAMSSITDVGMIFVRCKGGLSHHPDEYVSVEDIQMGARVLLDVIFRLNQPSR